MSDMSHHFIVQVSQSQPYAGYAPATGSYRSATQVGPERNDKGSAFICLNYLEFQLLLRFIFQKITDKTEANPMTPLTFRNDLKLRKKIDAPPSFVFFLSHPFIQPPINLDQPKIGKSWPSQRARARRRRVHRAQ